MLHRSTITLSSSASFSEYVWTNEYGDTLSIEREFMYDDITSLMVWVYVENANGCKDYDSLYVVVGSQPVDASPMEMASTTIGLLKILISLVVIKYKFTIDGENYF